MSASAVWSLEECSGPRNPIVSVQKQGNQLRVVAHIKKEHLDSGSATTSPMRAMVKLAGCAEDDAGHIIGKRLGGCGNRDGNIFPQDIRKNRGAFRSGPETTVYNAVKRLTNPSDYVEYTVTLHYANWLKTRPHQLSWDIVKVENGRRTTLDSNWMANPKGNVCGPTA